MRTDAHRGIAALVAALALAVLALVALAPSGASAAKPSRDGIYESCALHGDLARCIARLEHIRSGGFTAVLNYAEFYATEDELLAYSDAAHELGLELIHPIKDRVWWGAGRLSDEYPMLAASCACGSDRGFTQHVVGLLRKHKATWGWYVGDEAAGSDADLITRFSNRVRRLDRRHPRLLVAAGDMRTLPNHLGRFSKAADVIGADIYPVGTRLPMSTVGDIGRIVRAATKTSRRKSAIVLQAFSWRQYPGAASAIRLPDPRFPTGGQMSRMRDLAGRTDLVLWYSYFDVMRSANPSRNWAALVNAAR